MSHEARIVDTIRFEVTNAINDKLKNAILDEIGEWLECFSNYKKIDDEQYSNGGISLPGYKIFKFI